MAGEQDLGTAVLRLEVRTDQALSAINAFRNEVVRALGGVGDNIFDGIEQQGRNAGQRTGRALADGVRRATQGLRFENIEEALNFTGALNGTLRDLRTYREALVSLREVTPATAQGFAQLNDVIAATGQAIRNYSASTDQLVDDAVRVAIREQAAALREQRDAVRDAAREDRSWAEALRTIEQAQRSAAAATRIANQAFRDQAAAIGSIAQKGASDVAGTVRGVGKGIGAVAKGAVGLGKGVYNLGAEFGVFEEPKTGPIKQSIQQVIDRFKFLGEQAQTTRGQILRSIEAIGTGAGLVEIARNAELLKAALGGVDGAAQVAGKGLGLLDKVGGGFFNFLANRFPDTAFGEFAKLGAGATEVAAGIGSATSSLTNFATQGLSASLDGLQAFIGALSNVPPEAQAAVLALAGISLGFKEKPIVEGLTRVLEYLDGLSGKALKVRGDLSSVLNDLTQFQDKLAAANDQKLLPAFRDRGLTQLDDSVRQGESYRRITDAIAGNWERGARYLEKSNAELRRLVQQGLLLRPLSGSPVVPGGNLLPPGAPASSLPNSQQYARPIGPEPSLEFLQGKANQAAAALKALQDAAQALAARQDAQARAIGEFGASPITGRRRDGTAIGGSPAFKEDGQAALRALQQADAQFLGSLQKARADRQRRIGDATGSAIIGGAFPALFGQGLGASVGGGLGGLAGGALGGQFGFGLSLVGTALGAAFDAASERAKTLAKALDSPISQFQALADAALLSSKALEKQVASLISVGREAEAGALIQRDLISSYGSLDAAQENIKVTDELNRAWSRLTTGMIGFVNGPLKLLAQRLENDFQRNRNVGIEKALRDAGLGNRADALRRDSTNPILASDTAQIAAINDRYASELPAVKAATAALESARRTRQQILDLQLRQTAASVRDNTVLQAGVELDLIRLREREKLQQLRADGKLFTETSPGVYDLSPEAKRAQEEAASQRRQLAENAAASAERSARELRNARQLIGLEGERLTIKQEQQKVDEAQRLFAEADRTFRQKYSGTDTAKLVGAEKEAYDTLFNARLAAENNLTRIRLQSYEQIQRAEERIALSRQAVEDSILNAQKGRGLSGLGRGVLDDISSFRQQAAAVSLLTQRSKGDPNNIALAEQAKDARRNLTAAGEDLRNKMFDAFRTAQDAVRNISRSFENAKLSLAELQNTSGQGVNKYLNPQQVRQRQEQLNPVLLEGAQKAVRGFETRTGIKVPNLSVTGTLEQRNAQLIDIQRQFNNETQALEDLTTAQIDLATATRDLNTVIGGLRDIGAPLTDAINANSNAVNALALKNWEVNVNVQSPPAFIPSPG